MPSQIQEPIDTSISMSKKLQKSDSQDSNTTIINNPPANFIRPIPNTSNENVVSLQIYL